MDRPTLREHCKEKGISLKHLCTPTLPTRIGTTGGDKTGIEQAKQLHPLGMFRDAGLCLPLLKNIDKCCYMEPTPVQQYAIPIILDGRDMMACAQIGAGKTAAYLIPLIQM